MLTCPFWLRLECRPKFSIAAAAERLTTRQLFLLAPGTSHSAPGHFRMSGTDGAAG